MVEPVDVDDLEWTKLQAVGRLDHLVLPVAVQDVDSGALLMVAYVTHEAIAESLRTRRAVFFSTSKNALHRKGETSGDELELVGVRVNCESNSLLYAVRLLGRGSCHKHDDDGVAYRSCFHRVLATT